MQQFVSSTISQFEIQIPASTRTWLNNKLSSSNTDDMLPNINTHLMNHFNNELRDKGRSTVDSSLWTETEQAILSNCNQLCITYLTEIQSRLKIFNSEIIRKFGKYKCFLPTELVKIGQRMYLMVSRDLEGDRHEMVDIGCKKLLASFILHNEELIQLEMALAENLLPILIMFYNEEMTRVLEADVYSQKLLEKIHLNLADNLRGGLLNMFKFDEEGNNKIRKRFTELLGLSLPSHIHKNNSNMKQAMAAIIQCLEESKPIYVNKIKAVIQENPEGLDEAVLARHTNGIVQDALRQLENKIQKVRKHEPLDGHLASIKTHINDYWQCVQEENSLNLKRKLNDEEESKRESEAIEQPQKEDSVTNPDSKTDHAHQSVDMTPTELETARQELDNKLQRITEEIDSSTTLSTPKRKMLAKKIERIHSIRDDPNSTVELIRAQIKSLQIWIAESTG